MQKTQAQFAEARVIGTGVLETGAAFYLVASQSEEGRSHVVEQLPTRLSCDCKGFHYRGRCAHVAAVVAHKQRLQLAEADRADQAEDHASRGISPSAAAEHRTPNTMAGEPAKKTPAHGRYFGARSQEPFSYMR